MSEMFTELLPIYLKTRSEERHLAIRVSVYFKSPASSTSITSSSSTGRDGFIRELMLRLTNDTDPFFLYTLVLSEDEYTRLRGEQGLLVDFASFPSKLTELLSLCKLPVSCSSTKDSPKFVLQLLQSTTDTLTTSSSMQHLLEIVETNPFKHLVHLSLPVVPGNDKMVKEYLAECLRTQKQQNINLSEELRICKEKMSRLTVTAKSTHTQLESEVKRLQNELSERLVQLTREREEKIAADREENLRKHEQLIDRSQAEKSQLQTSLEEAALQFSREKRTLEAQLSELKDSYYTSQLSLSQTKSDKDNFSKRCEELEETLNQFRLQSVSSQSRLEENDNEIKRLINSVSCLEKELMEKEQNLLKLTRNLEQMSSERPQIEEVLEQKSTAIRKLESAVKCASGEVNKGNQIIQKLQNDIQQLQTKIYLKNKVTLEQERIINDNESSIQALTEQLQSAQKEVLKSTEVAKSSEMRIETIQKELTECREQLQTNDNVISWLNKQLNEKTLARVHPSIPKSSGVNDSLPLPSKLPIPQTYATQLATTAQSNFSSNILSKVPHLSYSNPHQIRYINRGTLPVPSNNPTPLTSSHLNSNSTQTQTQQVKQASTHINNNTEANSTLTNSTMGSKFTAISSSMKNTQPKTNGLDPKYLPKPLPPPNNPMAPLSLDIK